ncbi:glycerol kinase GlpK [Alkalicaulis satelles]|uniref:glycerol kinase n=1 Tax=Alkalicaulis satelles TaxID=2609175 RepID=A0A5M6ZJ53_9PROT|nr:glycerol kinase GlpK [Alkalicaulis satelles]KAA5802261.1 glycerol kinase GlpK [Alkalicaulis satelles]
MAETALLAIDQGTTSSRALAFDLTGRVIAVAQEEFAQGYPRPGWVEHDPEVLWATVLSTARKAFSAAEDKGFRIAALGVTNQRETTLVWDRASGRPVHNAIVWQDRRTADICARHRADGAEDMVAARAGLVLDPYFSATKLAWILDNVPGARVKAEAGQLAFGTVESFLIWRLTGGRVHVSDATNASRTSLYNLAAGDWDEELLALFRVPGAVLPEVVDCAGHYGDSDPVIFGRPVAISGAAGDQQAAAIGQACLKPGEMKSTYGTGAFMLVNTGAEPVRSRARLLATTAWRLNGVSSFALEGSVLSAGAAIQWLRDGLGLIARASEAAGLAAGADPDSGVYLVPAFSGLGAPYWDPDARGLITGLTRGSGKAEIARAALDSVAYQTHDLLEAMRADGVSVSTLKVDGGMARDADFLQRLADITAVEAVRPVNTESSAWGAAFLAGLGAGEFGGIEDARALWRAERSFRPAMDAARRETLVGGWRTAVKRALG